MTKGRLAVLTLCLLVVSPGSHSLAVQTQAAQTQPAQTQPAPDPAALDKILAPVALYPDALIAQILFCSTDPDKVRELNSWIQKNQKLKGTELQDAAEKQGFAPSFVAIVIFPQVVKTMADSIGWTRQLGQAFTADKKAVFASIQRLRSKAVELGNLKTTPQQEVQTVEQGGQQVIVIQPSNPQVVYVPQYNPQTVYVTQAPATQTVVVHEDDNSDEIAAGLIGFSAGVALGATMNSSYYYGPYGWGGYGMHYGGYYGADWDDVADYREDRREDYYDHREDMRENAPERTAEQKAKAQQAAADRRTSGQQTASERQASRQSGTTTSTADRQASRQSSGASASTQDRAARSSSGGAGVSSLPSGYESRGHGQSRLTNVSPAIQLGCRGLVGVRAGQFQSIQQLPGAKQHGRRRSRRGGVAVSSTNATRLQSSRSDGMGERSMCHFILSSLRFKRFVACGLMIVATALTAQNSIAQQTQKRFKTAEEAVQSAIKAAKGNNMPELLAIFGADAEDLLSSGDKVADRRSRQVILVALNEKWSLTSEGANTRILVIGNEKWRYPIPLVKDSGGWRFDTSAGREEILFRRIGRNELSTIRACSVYVRVQKEYAAKSHDGKPAGLYAQRFASQPGKQDGLYWKVAPGEDLSPLGAFVAEASPDYSSLGVSGPTPFHGYLYRLLTAQGPAAPGGAKSYISNGEITGGFALLAYPAEYRKSGVMAFIVNQDGVIYEKDLGEETVKVASQINEYNPDSSWRRAR